MIKMFIHSPSGWDSLKKISILNEHLKMIHADDVFEDHIIKPPQRKVRTKSKFAELLIIKHFQLGLPL